jgi:hypothetical protein
VRTRWGLWALGLLLLVTVLVGAFRGTGGVLLARQHVTGRVPPARACVLLDGLPDRACTPGALDGRVSQKTLARTVCRRGYTRLIRPAMSDTQRLRGPLSRAEGLPAGTPGEIDHLVPLELGGASDVRNLWLQPGPIPNLKDGLENRLHASVCSGRLTLAAAQKLIVSRWTAQPVTKR